LPIIIAAIGLLVFFKRPNQAKSFKLNENERTLHQATFNELNLEQFCLLMSIARWREVQAKEVVIEQGHSVECLSLVFKGTLHVDLGKNHQAIISPGQFIGEMSFVSGNPGSVTVTANQKGTLVQWPQQALKELLAQDSAISNCVQTLFQRDLIKKLGNEN
jgi:CRP-like cAMP-binding protein